jgi:hypothetical protein
MGSGGVDGDDAGDDADDQEQERSEDAGVVSTDAAEEILEGFEVASFACGRASKSALRAVVLSLALTLDARRACFFCEFWERDDGAYL